LQGGTPLFGPFFIPRNLTPDLTHRAEGGGSFEEFRNIMRTGIDSDHAHPQFGPYLQVMPWPAFQNMTDTDLRAIYGYLSAIPGIEGDPGLGQPQSLHSVETPCPLLCPKVAGTLVPSPQCLHDWG
jgi:hypothetical protein